MKKITFCIISILVCSLAFSAKKPCCSKKAGENQLSCKTSQTNIENNKGIKQSFNSEIVNDNNNTIKCNKANKCNNIKVENQCLTDSKKPWWMFWKKQSNANCPCKQNVNKDEINIKAS